jgi:hypothetical protein
MDPTGWVSGKDQRCLTLPLLDMVWAKGKCVKHFLHENAVDESLFRISGGIYANRVTNHRTSGVQEHGMQAAHIG